MRTSLVAAVLATALLALPAAAVAQDPTPSSAGLSLDVAELGERCSEIVSRDRLLCLAIVSDYLAPDGQGSEVQPGVFGEGDTQSRTNADVTLLKVDWDFKPPKTTRIYTGPCKWAFPCFPAKQKSVAALIQLECAAYEEGNVQGWTAMDQHGFSYHNALWQKDYLNKRGKPDLNAGRCVEGGMTRFWVTFYVPRNADWLRIVENPLSADALFWTVQR